MRHSCCTHPAALQLRMPCAQWCRRPPWDLSLPLLPLRCAWLLPTLRLQRQLRSAELAFMALLRQAQPPVSAGTTYDDALQRLQDVPAWQAITDQKRRRQLYMGWVGRQRVMRGQALGGRGGRPGAIACPRGLRAGVGGTQRGLAGPLRASRFAQACLRLQPDSHVHGSSL